MNSSFEKGYDFFLRTSGSQIGINTGKSYVDSINNSIKELVDNLNSFSGIKTEPSFLKGDIAEFWHAGSFNVSSKANESINKAYVDRSHEFASADITTNFGKAYGAKYYKNGKSSSKEQSKSILEKYNEYKSSKGKDNFEEYLQNRNVNGSVQEGIYSGQERLIPKEQVEEATEFLRRKIQEESIKRPEQATRYQETLDKLTNKISDNEGNKSVSLTDTDAKRLAELAKTGDINEEKLKELGVSIEEFVSYEHVMKQALKAGTSAAIVSLVLKVGPEIYKAIGYLIENGELSEDQFKDIGVAALTGASEGFIRGALSASIITACNSGLWGSAVKNVDPNFVGVATVLAMNTMKNAYKVASNQMLARELSNELLKELFIMSSSLISGGVAQAIIQIPILGFMLGSFVGSVVGGFAYDTSYSTLLSFCVDTGLTMFGLVDQNYELPSDVLVAIGVDLLEYERFEYETFEGNRLDIERFDIKRYDPMQLDITFVRRGVIGVSQIGYV